MSHVFISYAHIDYEFVTNVIERLTESGIQVWLDTDQLMIGKEWRTGIDQAIEEAFAVVVVMSPAAKTSEYVTYEWAFALGAKKQVIPILYKQTDMHPRLEVLQYLDFTDPLNRPWSRLTEHLGVVDSDIYSSTVQLPKGIPQAVIQAVNMLDSPNPDDRQLALDTIANMDHPLIPDTLAAIVNHPTQDVRIQTAFALVEATDYKDKRAIPGLVVALARNDERICRQAAHALGKIGDPDVVPKLFIRLYARSGAIQRAIANALIRFGSVSTPGFLSELNNSDRRIREISAWALGEIGDIEAVPGLIQCLSDNDPGVRREASNALIRIHAPAVPDLILTLKHDHWNVRMIAARILGNIGNKSAIDPLIYTVKHDENGDVRKVAVEALGVIADPSAIFALRGALNDTYWGITEAAQRALELIDTPEATDILQRWQSSNDQQNPPDSPPN